MSVEIGYKVIPYSLRKRKEIQNLSGAFVAQIPSTLITELDTSNFGKRRRGAFFDGSVLDLVCLGILRLCPKYSKINATYQDQKNYREFNKPIIGIAFDNGSNLKVLSLRNSANLGLSEIQNQIIELLEIYESNETLSPDFFVSTITVTDLTGMGITVGIPTLVNNQAIIIAISSNSDGKFSISCTYDHRILEGKYVAEFLSDLKADILKNLENETFLNEDIFCSVCAQSLSSEIELDPTTRGFLVIRKSRTEEILMCRVCYGGW